MDTIFHDKRSRHNQNDPMMVFIDLISAYLGFSSSDNKDSFTPPRENPILDNRGINTVLPTKSYVGFNIRTYLIAFDMGV